MLVRHLDTPEVCLQVVRNGPPPFSTATRSIWRGAQNPESGKCVPRGPSGGPQTVDSPLDTPEVCLEGVTESQSGKM